MKENELPDGLRVKTLGELAEYINGRAFKTEDWQKKGLPIIRIQNLTNSSDHINYYSGDFDEKHLIRNGDVLLSWSATLDIFIWEKGEALLNQHIFKILPNENVINKEFYYYLIKNIIQKIKSETHGSGMTHITKPKLLSIKVLLPSLEEQEKIVSKLDEQMAQIEIMKKEAEVSLSAFLAFNNSFINEILDKESKESLLDDLVKEFRYGTSTKSFENSDKGVPILRIPNVIGNEIDLSDIKYVEVDNNEKEKLMLKKGDFLLVRTNGNPHNIGRCSVFNLENNKYTFASYLIRVRVHTEKVLPEYINLVFKSSEGRKKLLSKAQTSAGNYNISVSSLQSIKLKVPSLEDQRKIIQKYDQFLDDYEEFLELTSSQSNTINQLSNSILNEVFGKYEIPDEA